MDTNIFLTQPLTMESHHLSLSLEEVSTRLEQDIDYCSKQLELGQSVELDGNVQERYGNKMVAGYFETQLKMSVNRPVLVSDNSGSGKTLVQLDPMSQPHHDFPTHLVTGTSTSKSARRPAATAHHGIVTRKNPPRPMNCWMLYRDTRHRELKDANPLISVQDISSICSNDWKQLSAAQKDQWRAKAKAAKEEHQRMYPDYKYSPRKPGQKKKRQSRKSTQAAAAAAAAATEIIEPNFDFNSFSDSTTIAQDNDLPKEPSASAITTDINKAFPVNAIPHPEAIASPFEFARQDILTTQFGVEDLHVDLDTFMDAYGFRCGADMDATLAPFFDPEAGLY